MAKYQGWLIHKQYFKVEVEAESWEEARDLIWDEEIDWSNPDDMDSEVCDIEEVKESANA